MAKKAGKKKSAAKKPSGKEAITAMLEAAIAEKEAQAAATDGTAGKRLGLMVCNTRIDTLKTVLEAL